MATPRLWSNVTVDMQSALGSALTITAISKASPGEVTSTAHGLSNGAYVYLEIDGMTELNKRVVRVSNTAANTFDLEGVDTTNFGTFTSGTAKEITYGTTFGIIQNLSASGGEPNFVDTTTIHDSVAKQIPGLSSSMTYSMENIWDPSDAGFQAAKSASELKAIRALKITFSDGYIAVFSGYVSAPGLPGGAAQALVTSPMSLTIEGEPTYYTS
jgi:hypothetical protein